MVSLDCEWEVVSCLGLELRAGMDFALGLSAYQRQLKRDVVLTFPPRRPVQLDLHSQEMNSYESHDTFGRCCCR